MGETGFLNIPHGKADKTERSRSKQVAVTPKALALSQRLFRAGSAFRFLAIPAYLDHMRGKWKALLQCLRF